ncbi:unnamed protein product [Thelazia callipaeda]|uniref:Secreted protein n=1 Tax=Thelazia callipaeda TaxID=103827 RepID=A0A0N5D0J6_THECL|nr:unnamed protein product [Thelazia callipaeda]
MYTWLRTWRANSRLFGREKSMLSLATIAWRYSHLIPSLLGASLKRSCEYASEWVNVLSHYQTLLTFPVGLKHNSKRASHSLSSVAVFPSNTCSGFSEVTRLNVRALSAV